MSLKIDKNLLWLAPYLEDASELIPESVNIREVKGLKIKLPKSRSNQAWIEKLDSNSYKICIYTEYYKEVKKRAKDNCRLVFIKGLNKAYTSKKYHKISPYSRIDILTSLAHELAHTVHWDHTPEHKSLECCILLAFMRRLEDSGYISEEVELQHKVYQTRIKKCNPL